jgi:hypothetical protein
MNPRDWINIAAAVVLLVAVVGLALARDLSWLVVIPLFVVVVWQLGRIQSRLNRNSIPPRGRDHDAKPSALALWMHPRVAVAYWAFFLIVLGAVMAIAATLQLTRQSVSSWPVIHLCMGVGVIALGLLSLVAAVRFRSK